DLLRETLAQRKPATSTGTETVRIANDEDLAAFAARLIQSATAEAVRNGKLRFTLVGGTASAAGTLTGVITENRIDKLAGSGTLVLDAHAVLTPLARDKARRLGLKIERRR
ncbi:MAG TPA: hypothetical protein VMZ01_03450, partial [Aestuariivirga sp.]|nr:hypothetical protein [Aestuariivirga sp.]